MELLGEYTIINVTANEGPIPQICDDWEYLGSKKRKGARPTQKRVEEKLPASVIKANLPKTDLTLDDVSSEPVDLSDDEISAAIGEELRRQKSHDANFFLGLMLVWLAMVVFLRRRRALC